MADLLMKAEDWRSRADELRQLAGRTKYSLVRVALLDMAVVFEEQAANLTTLALRLRFPHPVEPVDRAKAGPG
jgi:hypothetical protein